MKRLLFIGGRQLGASCLDWLLQQGHHVIGVLGRTDEADAEGSVPMLARTAGIPCLLPSRGNLPSAVPWVRRCAPDVGLCAMFPLILPPPILDVVPGGVFNLHGGRLPDFRGCLGHAWAIILGENVTGVAIHRMTAEVDAGAVLARQEVPVLPSDTGEELHERMVASALVLFKRTVPQLLAGDLDEEPQDPQLGRYFGKSVPYDRVIQWAWDAQELARYLRGMVFPTQPAPHTFVDGQRMQILEAHRTECPETDVLPGTVVSADDEGVVVHAGRGALQIRRAILHPHRGRREELSGANLASRLPAGRRLGR